MRFLVLGAAGGIGNVIARVLVTDNLADRVVLADIDVNRAKALASEIGSDKVDARHVDLRDKSSVKALVKDCDIVINSSWDEFNSLVTDVVLEEGKDMHDLSSSMRGDDLLQLHRQKEAEDAGIRVILELGQDSGLSNLLALQMVTELDEVRSIAIRDGDRDLEPHGFPFKFSVRGILEEWTWPAVVYENGKFHQLPPLSQSERTEFPEPVGTLDTHLTAHEEVLTLPRFLPKPVGRVDFMLSHSYDTFRILRDLGLLSSERLQFGSEKISPYEFLSKVLSLRQASMADPARPVRDVTCVLVRCVGTRDGEDAHLTRWIKAQARGDWNACATHYATGYPAALAALWLARGKVSRPGFWPPEACVDPEAFFEELHRKAGRWIQLSDGILHGMSRRSK